MIGTGEEQETRAALTDHLANGLMNYAVPLLLFLCLGETCSLCSTVPSLPEKWRGFLNRFVLQEFSWELKIFF